MNRPWLAKIEAILWETPMWVFLCIGVSLVGMVFLVGPYLENRQLAWKRDLIVTQAQRLSKQETSYRQMLVSLEKDDPVLLQRLAYHYLHLKPAGAKMLVEPSLGVKMVGNMPVSGRLVSERPSTVDHWLYQPMPVVGKDFPAYSMLDNGLIRVATSSTRVLVVGGGAVCVLFGLIPLSRIAKRKRFVVAQVAPMAVMGAVASPAMAMPVSMTGSEVIREVPAMRSEVVAGPVLSEVETVADAGAEVIVASEVATAEVEGPAAGGQVDEMVSEVGPLFAGQTVVEANVGEKVGGKVTYPSVVVEEPLIQVSAPPVEEMGQG